MIAPPAIAWPFIAAIAGFGKRKTARSIASSASTKSCTYLLPLFTSRGRSTPAEKIEPVPVMMMPRMSLASAAAANSRRSAAQSWRSSALAFPWARRRVMMPSARSRSIMRRGSYNYAMRPFVFAFVLATSALAADEHNLIVKNCRFHDGATMAEVRIHYVTIGVRAENAGNAVLILHGTGGSSKQFLNDHFAGVLFKAGGLLDASRSFIIIPDNIGHGQSSKPSDGLHSSFPHYDYDDMIELQHRLVESLGVHHLFLVMGTSMGGMHAWMWGERWPDAMDALVPLASAPTQIAGRNRIWRKMMIDDLNRGDITSRKPSTPCVGPPPPAAAEGGGPTSHSRYRARTARALRAHSHQRADARSRHAYVAGGVGK